MTETSPFRTLRIPGMREPRCVDSIALAAEQALIIAGDALLAFTPELRPLTAPMELERSAFSLAVTVRHGVLLAAVGCGDGSVRVFDLIAGHKVATFSGEGRGEYVSSVLLHEANGRLCLYFGNTVGVVRSFDIETGAALGPPLTAQTPGLPILDLAAFPSDGRDLLVAASRDGSIVGYEMTGFKAVAAPRTSNTDAVRTLAVTSRPPLLLSGCSDGEICVWRTLAGSNFQPSGRSHAHARGVTRLRAYRDKDSEYVASLGGDAVLRRWEAKEEGLSLKGEWFLPGNGTRDFAVTESNPPVAAFLLEGGELCCAPLESPNASMQNVGTSAVLSSRSPDVGDQSPSVRPGPTSLTLASPHDSLSLAELRGRVAALEAEHAQLLAGYAQALESDLSRLRSMNPAVLSGRAAESRNQRLTPPYLTHALTAIEDQLADMERFALIGDEAAARASRVAAASRSCSVLRKLCDDDDFHQMLVEMQEHATQQEEHFINEQVGGTHFRDVEVQLLQLAGLPGMLAEKHVDTAIAAYQANPGGSLYRMRNPMTFLGDLRQMRDASCELAESLSRELRQEQSRQRWKKLLTFGLGGTAIVVANSMGTVLLGPLGVAASGAIGSAAVGVAAQLVS